MNDDLKKGKSTIVFKTEQCDNSCEEFYSEICCGVEQRSNRNHSIKLSSGLHTEKTTDFAEHHLKLKNLSVLRKLSVTTKKRSWQLNNQIPLDELIQDLLLQGRHGETTTQA